MPTQQPALARARGTSRVKVHSMKKPAFTRTETKRLLRPLGTILGVLGWCVAFALIATGRTNQSIVDQLDAINRVAGAAPTHKKLVFYNKPPKTGSTTVRIAMSIAAQNAGKLAAECFSRTEWNEMGFRNLINYRNVDFYGCHTRLFRDRFKDIMMMRGGNVTLMTNTRAPDKIVLSAYLQAHRGRSVASITDPEEMKRELAQYRQFVDEYPVNALYKFHGGQEVFQSCPHKFRHESEMRMLAERYEVVVDLERPEESSAIVELTTGLKPNFKIMTNERTADLSSPMLAELAKVDTSHKSCGNALVHRVLKQQYNIIKDRILQNDCFNEDDGTYEECDKVQLGA